MGSRAWVGSWCAWAATAVLAGIGCADGSSARDAGSETLDADVASDAGPTGIDASVTRDASRPDATVDRDGSVPGLQCEACEVDGDCGPSSYCVSLPSGGRVCLRACVRDLPSCPPRFDCVDSLIMGREDPVCAPFGERCCVDADGDDHGVGVGCRGIDCDDLDDSVHASASETCNGVDDDCDGTIDEGDPGAGLVCATGMVGVCAAGVTACESGGIRCRPDASSIEEVCDGVDNDCDASVDEDDAGRALTRSCYDGPAGTEGVGGCTAGVRTCTGGEFRSCVGQVLPSAERCNGVDDDCNGAVDDGDPGGGIACSSSAPGICRAGTTSCVGGSVQCVSTIAPGSQVETCDGEDDDCDGDVDEDFMVARTCSDGVGACLRTGVRECDAAGTGTRCSVVAGTPSAESCDGVDNDCDSSIDEDDMGRALTRACYDGPAGSEGVGTCRAGVQTCTGGEFRTCAGQVLPSAELCDGLDNDCDGAADDGDPGSGIGCSASAPGVCRPGTTSCVGGSVRCVSTITPGTRAETCNGDDDDCDGSTDEDFMVGRACSAGTGACLRSGVTECDGTGTGTRCSVSAGTPGVEVCDAIDNDCDTLIDEDGTGRALTRACYDGPSGTSGVGSCRAGLQTCAGGDYGSCAGQVLPSAETCNGADDDCDGVVDDGDPGGGIPCSASVPGICSAGRTRCVGGAVQCVGDIAPGTRTEICDYLDNDCDASVDEGFLLGRVCTEGVGECLRSGVTECNASGSGTQCTAVPGTPASERCDYADNDCDAATDEGYVYTGDPASPGTPHAIGAACAAGLGVCRRGGVVFCASDGSSAVCSAPIVSGSAESCNYLDDDCDGLVDDGFVDAMGRYTGNTNCGACGFDCTEIYAFPNSFGTCSVSTGTPRCVQNCNPGTFNLNGIPDDGCEFVLDPGAIYVSGEDASAVDNTGCGLGPATTGGGRYPCRTITYGIGRAVATGRSRVLVADALYVESVTLSSGVSLLGGHRADTWERHVSTTLTSIRGASGAGHRRTIIASGITAITLVEGFVIEGASASSAGASSYAVYVNGGTSSLSFRDNVIYAGNGAPGAAGTAGGDGLNGVDGAAGLIATETSASVCTITRLGGSGGARTCGATIVDGGAGGSSVCAPDWDDASPYTPFSGRSGGAGSNGGAGGGTAGYDGETRAAQSCLTCWLPLGGNTMTGGAGTSGARGVDGAAGAGAASSIGSIAGSDWVGASGLTGGVGTHGGGGGGGGSGGGGDGTGSGCYDDLGGTGGGAGSGACGGTNGGGGGAGGGSFGVFIVNTTSRPVLSGNTIYRGFGGVGGNGGRGGTGGVGGAGAAGGPKTNANNNFCTGDGGAGASGGGGGHAGGGGGGAGGVAYGVYAAGTSGYGAAGNTHPPSGGGGGGGSGGASVGNSGIAGVAGASASTN